MRFEGKEKVKINENSASRTITWLMECKCLQKYKFCAVPVRLPASNIQPNAVHYFMHYPPRSEVLEIQLKFRMNEWNERTNERTHSGQRVRKQKLLLFARSPSHPTIFKYSDAQLFPADSFSFYMFWCNKKGCMAFHCEANFSSLRPAFAFLPHIWRSSVVPPFLASNNRILCNIDLVQSFSGLWSVLCAVGKLGETCYTWAAQPLIWAHP